MKKRAQKIRRIMRRQGVTNREIARKRGVHEVWVSMVIHGRGKSRPIEHDIARAVGVPVEELWPCTTSGTRLRQEKQKTERKAA